MNFFNCEMGERAQKLKGTIFATAMWPSATIIDVDNICVGHLVELIERAPGCVFAVVTAGKKMLRGSERIGVFRAIIKQTSNVSLISQHRN